MMPAISVATELHHGQVFSPRRGRCLAGLAFVAGIKHLPVTFTPSAPIGA